MSKVLEIRFFTCPACGWSREDHIYWRTTPWGITCKSCGAQYWWSWKHNFLLSMPALAKEPETISSEFYKLVEE